MSSSGKMGTRHLIRPTKSSCWWRCRRIAADHASWHPRYPLIVLAVVVTLAMIPQFARARENGVGEYELKAAILYKLARFVEWPATAFPDPQTPTVLCVLGHDPFGGSLTTMTSKNATNGRPLLVRHLKYEEATGSCHLLYISSSERKMIAQIFAALNGSSVLTVGEMDQFAVRGGMIQFTMKDKEVRFEINLDAASRAGLKISSRLLVLARIVNDQNRSSSNQEGPILSPISRSRPLTFWPDGEESVHGVGAN